MFACNHSTNAPMSLTACIVLLGTSQKTGKKPSYVASVDLSLCSGLDRLSVSDKFDRLAWRLLHYLADKTPFLSLSKASSCIQRSCNRDDTPSPLIASHRMAKHVTLVGSHASSLLKISHHNCVTAVMCSELDGSSFSSNSSFN